MQFHAIDIAIIIGYVVLTIFIGFYISKRASRNLESYFLGGNTIPWWALGVSNASGMFDISGTMLMVYWLFVYGLKSVWIPWLWPVFNQIFLMVFLSVWLRRSGVMTGAEWIKFRFGETRGALLSHVIVVMFAVVSVIGFLAYGFTGIGKFASTFLPWQLSADPITNDNLYGLIIIGITTVYVIKGGMFSVVFTELLQFTITTIASIWIGLIAIQTIAPDQVAQFIPAGWESIWFGKELGLDWSTKMPAAMERIAHDGWALFGPFVMMMLFKGYLQSAAGPAPNYDMQRVLSTKTPREAAKMSAFVNVVLLFPRYMLITGLTVLALVFFSNDLNAMGSSVDFEKILPFVLNNFVPQGLMGLMVAALLAAFMSNFSATVNAAPAYLVNDIYKRFVKPDATDKHYVYMSYAASLLVVFTGVGVGLFVPSINDMVQWIVSALFGGYVASNLLKWYWWRFNSYGYFWGMASGMVGAGIIPFIMPGIADIYSFPIILAISTTASVIASFMTPHDDMEVLKNFYLKVRPWGFWKPVYEALREERPQTQPNRDFGRDMFNVAVGICWQTAITASGIYVVLENWSNLAISASIVLVTTILLKFFWYDRLRDYPADLEVEERVA